MKSRVQILLEIDSVATWIPSDGVSGVADELEDMITDALEQCIEGLTVNKIKVRRVVRTFIFIRRINTVLLENFQPTRRRGYAEDEGEKTKMGGPIFTQSTWQLCGGGLLVLVPCLGQEVFNILVVEGSDVKTYLFVTSFNFHVEGDLYLIAAPWYKGGI